MRCGGVWYSGRVKRIQRTAWLLSLLAALLQVLAFPSPNFYALSWVCVAPLLVALFTAQGEGDGGIRSAASRFFMGAGVEGGAATPWQGFLLGYGCGFFWYLGSCYWIYIVMHEHGGLSVGTSLGILLLFCLYLGIHHAIFGGVMAWLAQPGRMGVRALAVAPLLWVALELLRCRFIGFPWDLLGTTQVENAPLAHLSTITGVYGLSFAVMVINAGFAAALLAPKPRRGVMLLAAGAGALVLQVGVFLKPPAHTADRYAVLVQGNIPVLDGAEWTTAYYQKTVSELVGLSKSLAVPDAKAAAEGKPFQRPELIVWPENPAPFWEHDPNLQVPLSELARSTGANLIVGASGLDQGKAGQEPVIHNSALLFGADGQAQGRYDKIHLVPFGEYVPFEKLFFFAQKLTREVGTFAPGTSRMPFFLLKSSGPPAAYAPSAEAHEMAGMGEMPGMQHGAAPPVEAGDVIIHSSTRAGVFICYESVFPDEVRQFAANGADYFVNLSNDGWYGDSAAWQQHLNMARMRAIENQRWLLFATNTGQTASVDPDGRIIASAPRQQRTALLAPFAVTGNRTFYTLRGDVFAFACAIISVVALLANLVRGRARA